MEWPYKSGEISDEFNYLGEKFIKKLKMAKIVDYWKANETSIIFWRKLTGMCRKIQDNQQLTNNFRWAGKIRKTSGQNFACLDQKWVKFLKVSRKFWDFLTTISIEKRLFHKFLLNISWISCSLRKYIPLEDNSSFIQQYFPCYCNSIKYHFLNARISPAPGPGMEFWINFPWRSSSSISELPIATV